MTDTTTTPTPGSSEALGIGCLCPVLDNGHGKGAWGGTLRHGEPVFWINQECPIHGAPKSQEAKKNDRLRSNVLDELVAQAQELNMGYE